MNKITFISPLDGDMLHAHDGITEDDCLHYEVVVAAPAGSRLTINGIPADRKETTGSLAEEGASLFSIVLPFKNYKNQLEAIDETTGAKAAIVVYRLRDFAGRYRLSIDDNIWFLRDIHQNTDRYASLFDNPYLAFLKQVNDTYGTKIHLNIFYQTDGFCLSDLSDKFKKEWQANADWIRLSFHALGEFPDMPYKDAGYDQVRQDCDLVMNEIRRFAGEELLGPFTTLHWGTANIHGSRALRDAGYKGQLGYFNIENDQPAIGYYLNLEETKHIRNRFIWKDNREDIIFVRTSIVIDKTDLAKIPAHLDSHEQITGKKPPYVDLLVHEQYFYPFYEVYEPDYRERILTAVKWAHENKYESAFLSDCIFR